MDVIDIGGEKDMNALRPIRQQIQTALKYPTYPRAKNKQMHDE